MPITKEQTVSDLLQEGTLFLLHAGSSSPRREAELLLLDLLACRRLDLYLEPHQPVSSDQEALFRTRLTRRAHHEPVQYITGNVEFCGLTLHVRPGVFIPRPETELIIEAARFLVPSPRRILDLCTGSGALAIALAAVFPESSIVATDLKVIPLATAAANAARHGDLNRIGFIQGDLFSPLRPGEGRFDLIVCNPPYIPERDRPTLSPEVRDHEPEEALFAPEEGTAFYRRVLKEAPSFLTQEGILLLELGAGQSAWFRRFAEGETDFDPSFIQDIAGIDRIAVCKRRE
ncbi:MAG: peptide chain release factor N(5)-glutamine methyltransferase [Candidatus Manganitrophaceae bacterium]